MARKRRRFTAEFKGRVALEALQESGSVEAIAARYELPPDQVSSWKRQLLDAAPEVFAAGASRKLSTTIPHECKQNMTDCNVDTTVDRMPMTGTVVGYDPGGNGNHGFARATVRDGDIVCVTTKTLQTAEDVVRSILGGEKPLGLGIDTLTCWSTGHSGWRPADHWLRDRYPNVTPTIVAPNSLYGAMSVNGMAVLVAVRQAFPDIFVTETHPKVLYYERCKQRYDYSGQNASAMNACLNCWLGVNVQPQTEHEWDAAISILPVIRGLQGSWRDLHNLPTKSSERLVHPCGKTSFMWPERNPIPPTPTPQPPTPPAQ